MRQFFSSGQPQGGPPEQLKELSWGLQPDVLVTRGGMKTHWFLGEHMT